MIPAANAIVIVIFIIIVMDDSFMKVTIITTTVVVIPFGISIDIVIAFVRLTLTPMSSRRMSTGIAAAAATSTNIIIVVGRRRGEWQSTKRGPSQHYRHDVDLLIVIIIFRYFYWLDDGHLE
jgi:hypothetical protein